VELRWGKDDLTDDNNVKRDKIWKQMLSPRPSSLEVHCECQTEKSYTFWGVYRLKFCDPV